MKEMNLWRSPLFVLYVVSTYRCPRRYSIRNVSDTRTTMESLSIDKAPDAYILPALDFANTFDGIQNISRINALSAMMNLSLGMFYGKIFTKLTLSQAGLKFNGLKYTNRDIYSAALESHNVFFVFLILFYNFEPYTYNL